MGLGSQRMHISSTATTYVCFAQQAAHMEQLIMENQSDVIRLAIPGYELTPTVLLDPHGYQCVLRNRNRFECFRTSML